jgi:hypothetical protein
MWVLAFSATVWPGLAHAQKPAENLVSELRTIRPSVPGLELEVVERDRFLSLENATGATIVVKGYDDEPYLRFGKDRRVEVNIRSSSKYVNDDRFGRRPVPPRADSGATPRWQLVSSDGSYRWFDHRIHYMSPGTPEEVTDVDARTKIFDWSVPMTLNGRPVRALGTLTWEPDSDPCTSVAPIAAIAAAIAAALVAAVLLRRRRRPGAEPRARKAGKEAW